MTEGDGCRRALNRTSRLRAAVLGLDRCNAMGMQAALDLTLIYLTYTVPGFALIQGYCYANVLQLPSIFQDFRVTLDLQLIIG
eukprot:SAG31_NODE_1164_length_9581_cov_16.106623_5_plen_83_part_00